MGAGYRERAADFLGACLPLPGAGSSLGSLSRLKVRTGPLPDPHAQPPEDSTPTRAPARCSRATRALAQGSRPTRAPARGQQGQICARTCVGPGQQAPAAGAVSCSLCRLRAAVRPSFSGGCSGRGAEQLAGTAIPAVAPGPPHNFARLERCIASHQQQMRRPMGAWTAQNNPASRILMLPSAVRTKGQTSDEALGQKRCPGRRGRRSARRGRRGRRGRAWWRWCRRGWGGFPPPVI